MLFASDYHDNRVHIDETHSNQEYYCPYCGAPLITRKGDQRKHHFAHKPNRLCTDTWVQSRTHGYDLSDWHNEWQSLFPKENQEVKLVLGDTRHRADVLIDRTVVEFQNSVMQENAFDDRNNFYFNLGYKVVWLFNLSDLYGKGKIAFEETGDGLVFRWENPKKAFNCYDIQSGCIDLFFQLSGDPDSCIVRVTDVSPSGFEQFHTTGLMSKEAFLSYVGLRDGVCLPPCRDDLEQDQQYQRFKEKYHIRLNKQQERALQAVEGSNLLLAVPGSGKTTVLVARLGYMVLMKNIQPWKILAVTYCKKAAAEMKQRFTAQFGNIGYQIDFRTINSLSEQIYSQNCYRTRTPIKKVLDDWIINSIIKEIYKHHTGEKYATENDVKELQTAITYIKNMMLTEEQIRNLESDYPHLPDMFRDYQQKLAQKNGMDYDDQMVFALRILRENPDVADALRARYKYICVDEAQDTSKIQHEIIRILAQGNNLFMVGDEDQSIYGFRAAYPKALLNFRYDYQNPYILRMERNYRSTSQIVAKAQAFISRNRGRYEKHMVSDRGSGEDVRLERVPSREAQYLRLLEIAKSANTETAFLYRDNESAVVLVDLLLRHGVAFALAKPKMNFFKTSIVQDIVAHLSLAVNPYDTDALDRLCNHGVFFLKKEQLNYAINNSRRKRITVYDALDGQMKYLPWKYRDSASIFRNVMNRVSSANTYDAIAILLEAGYARYLRKEGLDTGRLEILQILAKQEPTIPAFLNRLQELEKWMRCGWAARPENKIILSTIHSSKGQEYDSVYMLDIYDGRFPSSRPNIFCRSKDSADGEQEERRLFYVGITRAKNRLHLFEIAGKHSTFVDELFAEENAVLHQIEAEKQNRQQALDRQARVAKLIAIAENARQTAILNEEYKNLPVKVILEVKPLLEENYNQEEYLIYDQLAYRRVKCTKCGKPRIEEDMTEFVTCNTGICQECSKG